ncbi:MAG: potassium-transporting ATPase subunit F [Chitinophaga sp.]|nr:potassium-transporting ATPase subunit F [Chitinophaga sp.]
MPYSLNRSTISKRSNTTIMTALFVLSLFVFGYMIYVLLKPEKF